MTQEQISSLRSQFLGPVIVPGDADYDTVRRVYNGSIDRRPFAIARCATPSDVLGAVGFARKHDLPISVRGGGHNVAGRAVCDAGLMIDLSGMRSIRVDAAKKRVRAEAGVTYRQFDHETYAFGLATTGGTVSATGIAGLTLGGGMGWLMRVHGLACDNLLSADVVTADSRLLHASKDENADLFWGLRGGGGNFGIVTSFEYQLHDQGPLLAGMLVHPVQRGRDLLRFHRDTMASAPDEVIAFAGLLCGPDGQPIAVQVPAYVGPLDKAEKALQPMRSFGPPVADMVAPTPYPQLQQMLDPGLPAGLHNYWASNFLKKLDNEVIDILVEGFAEAPTPLCILLLEPLGGTVRRVGAGDSAFTLRDGDYNLAIVGRWANPADAERTIAWTKKINKLVAPYSAESIYVNYASEEDAARAATIYGPHYQRLAELKRKYDAHNLFRLNVNVKPA